ncbi:hypothetical protein DN062_02175 [Nitrincola tibetensis]|uniref:GIY-YIG domain-containing protein n=1 Tax=Nitrincola tibetensis TaxID=2219697 RepID=A0A364NS37_9GAMM|nr:hypothetical protein [Nitrincola tibetensis]RAU19901.1 hypothetical protein DN062_02175 [Nitrincola tibetensis]
MIYYTHITTNIEAAICPMEQFVDLKADFDSPGLYILIGKAGQNLTPAYVGISDKSVAKRVRNYKNRMWDKCILFRIPTSQHSINLSSIEHFFITIIASGHQFFSMNRRFSYNVISNDSKMVIEAIYNYLKSVNMCMMCQKITTNAHHYSFQDLIDLVPARNYYESLNYGTAVLKFTMNSDGGIVAYKDSRCSELFLKEFHSDLTDQQICKRSFLIQSGLVKQRNNYYYLTKDTLFIDLSDAVSMLTLDSFNSDFRWEKFVWGPFKSGASPFFKNCNDVELFMYGLIPQFLINFRRITDYGFCGFNWLQQLEQRVIASKYII